MLPAGAPHGAWRTNREGVGPLRQVVQEERDVARRCGEIARDVVGRGPCNSTRIAPAGGEAEGTVIDVNPVLGDGVDNDRDGAAGATEAVARAGVSDAPWDAVSTRRSGSSAIAPGRPAPDTPGPRLAPADAGHSGTPRRNGSFWLASLKGDPIGPRSGRFMTSGGVPGRSESPTMDRRAPVPHAAA